MPVDGKAAQRKAANTARWAVTMTKVGIRRVLSRTRWQFGARKLPIPTRAWHPDLELNVGIDGWSDRPGHAAKCGQPRKVRTVLTVRSGHSVSNLQRATARGFDVCPRWWEPVPFGAKRVQFKPKPTPSKLPSPLMPPFSMQGNQLSTRTGRKLPVPEVSESIEYP